ncbi:hypothetical protein Shyhy01_17460 [Streptomyces hygroscopicus subsp. hygroscopicus]|nr:hypothetical protein Shyhy01_17460 [Streptomyces hygroscopicus subsp. hygroscopicus]
MKIAIYSWSTRLQPTDLVILSRTLTVMRLGPQRALRKIRQDFRLATLRSTGARAADSARLIVRWVGLRLWRESPDRRGHPGTGPDVGAVGENGNALAFVDPDDSVGAGCGQVVGASG